MAERKKKVCSFCGRGEHDVKLLISGMNGYICDHCVAQAQLQARPVNLKVIITLLR